MPFAQISSLWGKSPINHIKACVSNVLQKIPSSDHTESDPVLTSLVNWNLFSSAASDSRASRVAPVVKTVPAGAGGKRQEFGPWVRKTPCRRPWQPTPVRLPGESHGGRRLVGYSPWGRKESDTTEQLHSHFSLSCIGEGNGNPLQCSCLENPRDGGASWADVYGVTQSWTWLKWLSSSSSRPFYSTFKIVSLMSLPFLQHTSVIRTL